jgi:hypothetical protein
MSQVTLDHAHYHIHDGSHFFANYYIADLDIATPFVILLQTGNKEIHLLDEIQVTETLKVELYEDTTFSAAGTGIDIQNRNRNSDRISELVITHTPTITLAGDKISERYIIAASLGANLNPIANRSNAELILKAQTVYQFILTTLADDNQVPILLDFYED